MERLTERDNNVALVIDCACLSWAIERLAEYGDTGYTPEEINALKSENASLRTRIEAERVIATKRMREFLDSAMLVANVKNKQLQADCAAMREAMEEFCAKVEDGKIRSRGTYLKFVEILNSTKGVG